MTLEFEPAYPKQSLLKIGIIGAGEIVKFCHLPAYRDAGFLVTAICDLDREKAQALANAYSIENVFDDPKQLIAADCVDIVDLATPSQALPALVELACKHKKHLLCQKPLALDLPTAKTLAQMIKEAGVKGAVNHQMRYSPSIGTAKSLLKTQAIGNINYAAFNVNVRQPWEEWKFWHKVENFTLYGHTIHYFDTFRFLFEKTPQFIYTQVAHGQDRDVPGHLRDYSLLKFDNEFIAQIDVNHDNKEPTAQWQAGFRIEGSQGVIEGTNGALHNYPHGKEDTLSVFNSQRNDTQAHTLQGRWFPDAFKGTMGELMLAIEQGRQPENSVADGINTIKMVMASILSAKENRPIYLAELEE